MSTKIDFNGVKEALALVLKGGDMTEECREIGVTVTTRIGGSDELGGGADDAVEGEAV